MASASAARPTSWWSRRARWPRGAPPGLGASSSSKPVALSPGMAYWSPDFQGSTMATRQAVLGMERGAFFYGSAAVFRGITFLLDGARQARGGGEGTGT